MAALPDIEKCESCVFHEIADARAPIRPSTDAARMLVFETIKA